MGKIIFIILFVLLNVWIFISSDNQNWSHDEIVKILAVIMIISIVIGGSWGLFAIYDLIK